MNTNIQRMGSIVQRFVSIEIDKALTRHRLPGNSPVRAEIERHVEVVGEREVAVRILDESGRSLTLDARIDQLKHEERFSGCFPPDPPRISRRDAAKLHANFDKILTGEIVVE